MLGLFSFLFEFLSKPHYDKSSPYFRKGNVVKTIFKVDPLIRAKHDVLIDEPICIRVNEFNEEAAEKFAVSMAKAHNTGQSVIPIYIDSYGGECHSLQAMMAEIENAKLPVATIAVGKAMSCGAILLTCGTDGMRYMDDNCVVMIHEVSAMSWGKKEELKSHTAYVDELNNKIFRKMARNCGHNNPDYFMEEITKRKNADWFLDSKEAKKHKLITQVKMPRFTTTVSVNMEFN